MLAGGINLLQVANDSTEVVVNALGVEQTLSDMTVTVTKIEQLDTMTRVDVTTRGVKGADPVEGWRLLAIANGEVLAPLQQQTQTCDDTDEREKQLCTVEFAPTQGSVTVAYIRAGAQVQWAP